MQQLDVRRFQNTGLRALEEGFRLLARADDVEAILPVLQVAGIDITPLG